MVEASFSVTEAAIVTPEKKIYEHSMPKDIMGAAQLLEELAIQFDIIDPEMDLSDYKVIILPDTLLVSDFFQEKIEQYVKSGGIFLLVGVAD